MVSRQSMLKIIELLREKYPEVKGTALNFSKPLELLVATILAAQCTDEQVNAVCCKMLAEEYDSEIPKDIDELTRLPGVARKTANLVLSNAFGINQGIAMDTHMRRLSKRLGLSEEKQSDKMERDLMQLIPKEEWFNFTYLIVAHGRNVCTARNPRCGECMLKELCPSAFTF